MLVWYLIEGNICENLNSSWRLSCNSLWKYWLRRQMLSSGLLPLKMGPIGCPETSVRNHHYSLRNKPEERSSQLLRGGSLKLRYWLSFDHLWEYCHFYCFIDHVVCGI
jgi:hypothetical protein